MSWHPECGACHSRYRQFNKKNERDFAASAARKNPKNLVVRTSEYQYGRYKQHTAYTLQVWFLEE